MIHVTRRERFNAAHKLYNPKWSKEENEANYGKCANENWHGHNYHLFVTVKGNIKENGYVVDLGALSSLINREIIEKVDHKNLNMDVDFLKDVITSTENLTLGIWNILAPLVEQELNCTLHCVKLFETENNFVEYYG